MGGVEGKALREKINPATLAQPTVKLPLGGVEGKALRKNTHLATLAQPTWNHP